MEGGGGGGGGGGRTPLRPIIVYALQKRVSFIRRLRLIPSNIEQHPPGSSDLEYNVYDLPSPDYLEQELSLGHVCGEAKLISPVHWQKPSQTEEHAH